MRKSGRYVFDFFLLVSDLCGFFCAFLLFHIHSFALDHESIHTLCVLLLDALSLSLSLSLSYVCVRFDSVRGFVSAAAAICTGGQIPDEGRGEADAHPTERH